MAEKLFSSEDKERIVAAVKQAELNTSGEIRVHIENHCPEELMDRAAYLFEKLKMHKTELRNGVLFYLAVKDHQFAILGDAGINAVVEDDFWECIKEKMTEYFKQSDFAGGLECGILRAGEKLKSHFPYQSDDVNELPDEISFGK
ncbi:MULTISPECIES: TPM domain-containing protein [Marinilabiliaceae]|uniref:TLP18.3, Psb32 and MOLO-1 founding protein of phosphatase n=2 Tax=Marinilabiliaceae TaxID=558415 RepID=A0A1T5BN79_9BACT|nr:MULTISPECIES: TPM domain-containing protein [Marinilabiliaceae]ASB49649.1 hypothetical protein CDL62_11100 [Alkalitalea saponilacus]TCO09628.1 TLP18.3/Psb32/MOLO-1 phosphatase superfamily protein [Natronoflexus pectinivorans]SKB48557.1 TLP18.3, Psb32 and MOLO-1 founding protein of phosphatase [Alkalitalea saponilacus]